MINDKISCGRQTRAKLVTAAHDVLCFYILVYVV